MSADGGLRERAPACRREDHSSRWVEFELAGQGYALPILQVREVLAEADIEPVPGAPEAVLGVINLRGAIVSVIDLRLRLRHAWRATGVETRIIIVEPHGEPLGLRVDRIADVRNIPDAAIKPAPALGAADDPLAAAVQGVFVRNGKWLTLLDVAALVAGSQA